MKSVGKATILAVLFIVNVGCSNGENNGHDANNMDGTESESICQKCEPQCEGKECGDDECGWYCGTCTDGKVCVGTNCGFEDASQCQQANCGDDLIGGSCGTCPVGWACDLTRCYPDGGGCGDVGGEGKCVGGFLATCDNGSIAYEYCEYRACFENGGIASCQEVNCPLQCFGRECGEDGCGGRCGECTNGDVCDEESGLCIAQDQDCAGVQPLGECHGHVLVSCDEGEVVKEQCLEKGKICLESDGEKKADCCWIQDGTPCTDLPPTGHCEGDILYYCSNSGLKAKPCVQLGYGSCGRVGIEELGCVLE